MLKAIKTIELKDDTKMNNLQENDAKISIRYGKILHSKKGWYYYEKESVVLTNSRAITKGIKI